MFQTSSTLNRYSIREQKNNSLLKKSYYIGHPIMKIKIPFSTPINGSLPTRRSVAILLIYETISSIFNDFLFHSPHNVIVQM